MEMLNSFHFYSVRLSHSGRGVPNSAISRAIAGGYFVDSLLAFLYARQLIHDRCVAALQAGPLNLTNGVKHDAQN
jgi:hypothetical protein